MPTALITGASRGFGRALGRSLAGRGYDLVVDARDGAALAAAVADWRLTGTVTAVPGDVTDPAHRAELVAQVRRLGGLDLLVNNASTLGPSPLPSVAEVPLDALTAVLDTNVVAPVALIQQLVPALRQAGGAVVDVTSDAAVEPYEGWGAYGASKAALDQITAILAAENPDLRVYAFDPGDMRTAMHQDAFPGEDISDRPEPETVVPKLLALLDRRPASGRYTAAGLPDLPAEVTTATGAGR